MITATEAYELYEKNAFLTFTTMEAIYERIKEISRHGGACSCQVGFDSISQKNSARDELVAQGFRVERYNGSDDILDIEW